MQISRTSTIQLEASCYSRQLKSQIGQQYLTHKYLLIYAHFYDKSLQDPYKTHPFHDESYTYEPIHHHL